MAVSSFQSAAAYAPVSVEASTPVYGSSGERGRSGSGGFLRSLLQSGNPDAFANALQATQGAFQQGGNGDSIRLSVGSPDAIGRAMEAMQSDHRTMLDMIRGTPAPRARFDNAAIKIDMPQVDFTGDGSAAASSRLWLLGLVAVGGFAAWKLKPWNWLRKK